MPKWLFYCILADLIWGVWGVVPKAASSALSPLLMQVLCTAGLLPVALTFAFSKRLTTGNNLRRGVVYAFVTGLCGSIGNVAMLVALKRGGEASAVLPLTGMFPLVTVVLARLFLKEKLNLVQGCGIGLALAALFLFNAQQDVTIANKALLWLEKIVSVWMAYSLFALALYGIAGITQKLATNHISTELSTLCFAAAFLPVAGAILITQSLAWKVPQRDWLLSLLFGALMGFGMLANFAAYRRGTASIVTAVTALYPALTVALAVPMFGERLDAPKLVAIVLALAAGVALSYERTVPFPSGSEKETHRQEEITFP